MKLEKEAQRAHASMLINDVLFNEIMDGLEQAAITAAIYADSTEDDVRHAHLVEARSIRSLRAKLKNLAARGDTEAGEPAQT